MVSYPTTPYEPCTPSHSDITVGEKQVCIFAKYLDHDVAMSSVDRPD